MGTIKKGILGGFSGKVGTVVGGTWNGISYMRSLPAKVKNPRTEKQLSQRNKLAFTVSTLKPLTPILRIGWKDHAQKQSAFNAATAHTIKNAIEGTYPGYYINPAKLLISKGTLPPAENPTIDLSSNKVLFSWDDNSATGNAKPTDQTMIAILNISKNEAIIDIGSATRAAQEYELTINRPTWKGDIVYRYFGFISQDQKEVSNSRFVMRS